MNNSGEEKQVKEERRSGAGREVRGRLYKKTREKQEGCGECTWGKEVNEITFTE